MNAIMAAWFVLALWLFIYAARTAIADLAEGAQCCGLSWCDCEAVDA